MIGLASDPLPTRSFSGALHEDYHHRIECHRFFAIAFERSPFETMPLTTDTSLNNRNDSYTSYTHTVTFLNSSNNPPTSHTPRRYDLRPKRSIFEQRSLISLQTWSEDSDARDASS